MSTKFYAGPKNRSPFRGVLSVLSTLLPILAVPLLLIALVSLGGILTKVVWNTLSPLFHGPSITFWQGVALNIVLAVVGSLLERIRPISQKA